MNERLRPQVSDDFLPGDFVRRRGSPGIGMVESIVNEVEAWVSWDGNHRDLLPFGCLRRVAHRGEQYDERQT